MRIAGYEFEHICAIEPTRDADGSVRRLMPQDRYQNARNLPFNRYGAGLFFKFKIQHGFGAGGVYVLTVDDEVRYAGEGEVCRSGRERHTEFLTEINFGR